MKRFAVSKMFVSENSSGAYVSFEEANATIAELRAKLTEAEKVAIENKAIADALIGTDLDTVIIRNAELQQQLAKLRAAVPEDVQIAISRYRDTVADAAHCRASGMHDLYDAKDAAENNLLSLIGSLITRSKEERRKEIVDAVVNFMPAHYGNVFSQEVEEYADRVLKGE